VKPFLSVIVPTYNGERYIAQALGSVLREEAKDLEVIVVDDGSDDRSLRIVDSFASLLPLRTILNSRIGNWVKMSNIGLREARGDWVSFLHQDDFWLPGRLGKVRHAAASAPGALLLHHALFVDPDGRHICKWTCPLRAGDIPPQLFLERLLVQNFIAMPSPVFRRAAALREGGMDETLWFTPDWDLWLRLGAMGPVRFIGGEPLAAFRIHMQSQTIAKPVRAGEWRDQLTTVLHRHLDRWAAPSGGGRHHVARVARASIEVNVTLAAASRGERVHWGPLLSMMIRMGPRDWWRYLRDSRIVERVRSRLGLRRGT